MSSFRPYRKRPMASFSASSKRARFVSHRSFRSLGETKYVDGSVLATAPLSGTPQALVCGLISEGSDVNQRVGRKVSPLSLKIRGTLNAVTNVPNRTRLVLIRCRGAYTDTITDYLNGVTAFPVLDKCQVLRDEERFLDGSSNNVWDINWDVKLSPKKTLRFLDTGSGNDVDGQIVLLVETSVAADGPGTSINCRMFYKDV